METVSFKAVAAFTMCQLAYLLLVYGITWIPIAGFLFPLPIIALIPIRALVLPKVPQPAQTCTSCCRTYNLLYCQCSQSMDLPKHATSPCSCHMVPCPLHGETLPHLHLLQQRSLSLV